MTQTIEQRYRIESRLSAVHEVERDILHLLRQVGYSEDDLYNVRLAIDEACINAIRHGNREDPDKAISIQIRVDPGAVRICVEDEGDGFDYTRVIDPRDLDRLEETGGRGLFLIQQFMEQVHFNERGNSICMVYQKGKDLMHPGPIRKRVLNGIAIVEVLRAVGPEMARAWLDEVRAVASAGFSRVILDLRRASVPCSEFYDAIFRAAEIVARVAGALVVICPHPEARERLKEMASDGGPEVETSLPDAVRRLSRGEVTS